MERCGVDLFLWIAACRGRATLNPYEKSVKNRQSTTRNQTTGEIRLDLHVRLVQEPTLLRWVTQDGR